MNCTDVRENLSAYIDGMLDAQLKDMMDTHLATCRACRQEFLSMKALVEELGESCEMKAPEDFLDTLHERLEKGSWFTRIKEALFVPAPIKIPLEFATVGIVGVLIFSVYTVYSPRHEVPVLRSEIAVESATDRAVIREREPQEVLQAAKADKEGAPGYVQAAGQQPVELALIVKKQVHKAGSDPAVQKGEVPVRAVEAPKALRKGPAPSGYNALTAHRGLDDAEKTMNEQTVAGAEKKQDNALQRDDNLYDYPATVKKLHELIGLSGGRILSEELDRVESGQERDILAEIPAGQYRGFVEGMAGFAQVKGPLPEIPENRQAPVLVRISLVPEE